MVDLYPELVTSAEGMLDVGDGNRVHWFEAGDPSGLPAVLVHGGPGSGCPLGMGRALDPAKYRIIGFDQRGCGRSTPHASDPATDLSVNTTEHLVADMERLRIDRGVERWLLRGGSWPPPNGAAGRTNALAFVRICAWYYSNYGWLEEGALIRDAGLLADIPGVLIHGRLDLSCPTETAVALADAWPGVDLQLFDDAGHKGTPSKRAALLRAADRFAGLR